MQGIRALTRLWAVTGGIAVLMLAGGDAASAKKVKTEATFTQRFLEPTYSGGMIRFEYHIFSKNRRCRQAPTSASFKLHIDPDPEYQDELESDGLLREVARTNPISMRREGKGRLAYVAPGTDLFRTYAPSSLAYTGHYTFDRWWRNYSYTFGRRWSPYTSHEPLGYAAVDISGAAKGQPIGRKFKVRFRKGKVLHVIKCVKQIIEEPEPPSL